MAVPYLYDHPRLDERLYHLLRSSDPRLRLYIYRQSNGKLLKPYIYAGRPFPDLTAWIQRNHDGGEFRFILRRGETMLVSAWVLISPLITNRKAFDAFNATYM